MSEITFRTPALTGYTIDAAKNCVHVNADNSIAYNAAACDRPITVHMNCQPGSVAVWAGTLTCSDEIAREQQAIAALEHHDHMQMISFGITGTSLIVFIIVAALRRLRRFDAAANR